MGRDSEWALAAAANAVRSLRMAGLMDKADAFASKWQVTEEDLE